MKRRLFTTLPTEAIQDTSLTALELRCLAAIAARDGMSKIKNKGGGCFARRDTLAADIGTDVANFSKALSRLIELGYIDREQQKTDKRRFTLRVNYGDDLGGELATQPEKVGGELNTYQGEIGGGAATYSEETGEVFERETLTNTRLSARSEPVAHTPDYSSLSEELYFDESKELNSTKWRNSSFDDLAALPSESELDSPEGGLGGVSIWQHLPSNIETLSLGAQVAKIEHAYGQVGRDADSIVQDERLKLSAWLSDIADTCIGGDWDATGQQANRLYEELAVW